MTLKLQNLSATPPERLQMKILWCFQHPCGTLFLVLLCATPSVLVSFASCHIEEVCVLKCSSHVAPSIKGLVSEHDSPTVSRMRGGTDHKRSSLHVVKCCSRVIHSRYTDAFVPHTPNYARWITGIPKRLDCSETTLSKEHFQQ